MAVPLSTEEVSVNDDIQKLALAQSYFHLTESAAWKDLSELMEGLVSQAQEDMFKSKETDPLKILEEKSTWKQRMLMKQSVLYHVQAHLNTRESILEEMKQDEYATDNA